MRSRTCVRVSRYGGCTNFAAGTLNRPHAQIELELRCESADRAALVVVGEHMAIRTHNAYPFLPTPPRYVTYLYQTVRPAPPRPLL